MSASSFEADFEVASRIAHVQPVKGLREKVDPRHTTPGQRDDVDRASL
jgi:hypothetical protein